MAAGIGSRFGGGIKQLEPVGSNGEIIMDYSIHDAIEAGFDRIVFIIRKDIEADFREIIGNRIEKICAAHDVEVGYAFQALDALPEGFSMVITADHGGHARTHGTEMPEDMTIPIAFYGPQWEKGKALEQIRLLDIAPTIVDMMGCEAPADWDGVSLLKK
jgi:bisphosphoglycerate-independent phosphoglycerate mutase (AlkP superfamily)